MQFIYEIVCELGKNNEMVSSLDSTNKTKQTFEIKTHFTLQNRLIATLTMIRLLRICKKVLTTNRIEMLKYATTKYNYVLSVNFFL